MDGVRDFEVMDLIGYFCGPKLPWITKLVDYIFSSWVVLAKGKVHITPLQRHVYSFLFYNSIDKEANL